jgi:hypothetical protein
MKRDGTKPVAARHEVTVATMVISKRSGKRGSVLSAEFALEVAKREKSMGWAWGVGWTGVCVAERDLGRGQDEGVFDRCDDQRGDAWGKSCRPPGGSASGGEGDGAEGRAADRTERDIPAGELAKQLAPSCSAAPAKALSKRDTGRSELGASGVETDATDLVKAAGQDVLDETTQEGNRVDGGGPLSLRTKGHGLRAHGEQATVGEADAVGVAAEVIEDVLATCEGWLGVEVPLHLDEGARETGKPLGVSEVVEACEASPAILAS